MLNDVFFCCYVVINYLDIVKRLTSTNYQTSIDKLGEGTPLSAQMIVYLYPIKVICNKKILNIFVPLKKNFKKITLIDIPAC